jgi:hypothetical protein
LRSPIGISSSGNADQIGGEGGESSASADHLPFLVPVDSQTNTPLRLTTSVWSPKEGALNIDKNTIIGMGSGRFDIKNRVAQGTAKGVPRLVLLAIYLFHFFSILILQ